MSLEFLFGPLRQHGPIHIPDRTLMTLLRGDLVVGLDGRIVAQFDGGLFPVVELAAQLTWWSESRASLDESFMFEGTDGDLLTLGFEADGSNWYTMTEQGRSGRALDKSEILSANAHLCEVLDLELGPLYGTSVREIYEEEWGLNGAGSEAPAGTDGGAAVIDPH